MGRSAPRGRHVVFPYEEIAIVMLHMSTRRIVVTLTCLLATTPHSAEAQFTGGDAWRNEFRVGQAVEMDPGISPPPLAWIQCVVSENNPNAVMRLNCQAYDGKPYYAGSQIASSTGVVAIPATVPIRARAGDWVEVQNPVYQTWERMQVVAVANGRAIVRYPWDANSGSLKVVLARFVRGGSPPPPPPAMPRSIVGTNWSMVAMTKRGEPVREVSSAPDVEFTRAGTWGILRAGNRREAGRYRVQGNVVSMVYDEGQPYGTYRMVWQPAQRRLELVSGEYTMRLKYIGPIAH